MKLNKTNIRILIVLSLLGWCLNTSVAQELSAQTKAVEEREIAQLKHQLILLNKQIKQQQQTINQIARQVLIKEADLKSQQNDKNTHQQATVNRPTATNRQVNTSSQTVSNSSAENKKSPDRGRSTEDVLLETHNVFDRPLTVETSFTYSYYSRKDLVLRGFLALDAIFLGNLNLDRIRSNTIQMNLVTRYSATDRWQFEMNIPVMYRWNQFDSVGEGNSSQRYETAETEGGAIGDMSIAAYYRLMIEGGSWPDIVWNVRVKAPTGEHPFGIPLESSDTRNLTYPTKVATGSGVWGISTGFSIAKTYDPAIVFFNLNYGWSLPEEFGDLSALEGNSPGEIDLGDYVDYSVGLAFAVSEKMSVGMSFNQRFYTKTKQKLSGFAWEDIPRSDTNTATLSIGATLALSDSLSMVTNIGAGLTEDSPDYQVSLRFPYRF
ncbi:MAG: transporter [Shewanella sp.]